MPPANNHNSGPPDSGLKSLEWLWRLSLSTPLIYMVVSIVVRLTAFSSRETDGFRPLASATYGIVVTGVATACAILTVAIAWLRMARLSLDAERYRRLTLVMLALCDLIAFTGMVLYLIQGDVDIQGALTLLAWFDYALSRPAPRAGR